MLFLTLIVTMYLAGAITLLPSDLLQSRSATLRTEARQAAISGVNYAITRLRNNPQWRGDGSGDAAVTTVNLSDMIVREDHGNVVGLVRSGSSAEYAQFRIRFNDQASSGGPTGLGASGMVLDLGYLSVNNLPQGSDSMCPTVSGASPPAANPVPYHLVPARSVWLSVDGRAGAGLYGLSASNPNPTVSQGLVSSALVHTAFLLNPNSTPVLDAVAMSGGDFVANLQTGATVSLSSSVSTTLARIRTEEGIKVSNGLTTPQLVSTGAEAYSGTTAADTAVTSNVTKLVNTGGFYQIPAGNVTMPAATAPTMPAGTYVIWQDASVHYYDMSLSAYQTYMANPLNAADPGQQPAPGLPTAGVPSSMSLSQDKTTGAISLQVQSDTNVTGTTATNDLAIIPRAGAATGPGSAVSTPDPGTTQTSIASTLSGGGLFSNGGTGQYTIGTSFQNLLGTIVSWGAANPSLAPPTLTFSGTTSVSDPSGRNYSGGVVNDPNGSSTWGSVVNSFLGPLMQAWMNNNPNAGQDTNFQSVVGTAGIPTASKGLINNSAGDTLSPANLSLTFAPTNNAQFAVLAAPGNLSIGAGLGGVGGSLVAQGNINITGMGVSLAANPNAKQGVSLYAQGNVTVDTFQQTGIVGTQINGNYQDLGIKGVIYSWGSFNAVLGDPSVTKWGGFNLQGAMVAYGGNPSNAPVAGQGMISIVAANTSLEFDPSYLQNLINVFPSDPILQRCYWSE